jgi:hypothetical protein
MPAIATNPSKISGITIFLPVIIGSKIAVNKPVEERHVKGY